ncbi:unnamed protein product [Adineta ricciae]|uniref:Uncharacterized protein n=1 Tax=Adineta ricciae TaxID=249248 RepID=A0A816D3J4_ADIRI|nr:unnamed protein product [Adineta ricciae]CAF1631974.1 unnamed protein product [Adineta ricciae]
MNSTPFRLVSVPLTDREPFKLGAHIIQYGGSGEFTSFAIISHPASLLIAYTNTQHLTVFSDTKAPLKYVDPNDHKRVVGQPPYGVLAIYRLEINLQQ